MSISIDMALCHLEHYFLKKSLYVEGVKFHRSGIFDKKEFLQYWQCSHYKTQKCKCHAVTKYVLVDIDKSMDTSSSSADSDFDGGCQVDPRLCPDDYKEVLISAHPLTSHLPYHDVDVNEALAHLAHHHMDKMIEKEPHLDPRFVYEQIKVLIYV